MLVLSRKTGEQVCIGDNIRVVIHRVAGNRVTIGIEAPNDVLILRGELQVHDAHRKNDSLAANQYNRNIGAVATLARPAHKKPAKAVPTKKPLSKKALRELRAANRRAIKPW